MGAGRDAGQLADAALHKVGQRLGLGSPRTQQRPVAPAAVPDSPASTTGSSQDLDAAASMPLPGRRSVTAECIIHVRDTSRSRERALWAALCGWTWLLCTCACCSRQHGIAWGCDVACVTFDADT